MSLNNMYSLVSIYRVEFPQTSEYTTVYNKYKYLLYVHYRYFKHIVNIVLSLILQQFILLPFSTPIGQNKTVDLKITSPYKVVLKDVKLNFIVL